MGALPHSFDTFDLFGTRAADRTKRQADYAAADAVADPIAVDPAVDQLKNSQTDITKKRLNLFATDGGINGQELTPNQVSKRPTLLGN